MISVTLDLTDTFAYCTFDVSMTVISSSVTALPTLVACVVYFFIDFAIRPNFVPSIRCV